ncbi:MAG: GntR family transcriptional regulator [Comamonadaceae bacterium PBBC1]|nr:MAG: GntR family transcriptional regulator [Comamonadaceae bacterium PBBC1]
MTSRHRTKDVQWESLFALQDKPAMPLQQRLRMAAVEAILEGRLPPGATLPSSRELAKALGLSRNTVTSAYMRLIDDGFLEAHPRSGVFVKVHGDPRPSGLAKADWRAKPLPEPVRTPQNQPEREAPAMAQLSSPDWSARLIRSLSDRRTLAKPDQWRQYPYPFVYGTFDPQLFPTEAFRECCVHSLARVHLPQWTPDFELSDVPELIEQIRLRLLPKRGVFALPEEILITVGAQHAYYMLGEALFDAQSRVGLEEPGHPHARNSFASRQPQWQPLAVDDQGLVVDHLPPLDYVYVTPSHQSPTTRTLSLERRKRLLALAEQRDFVVIEDDYEAENLYVGEPMPALKSLDKVGRVIYVGSISKSLSPSLRLGYIVAPRALIAELRVLRHAMVRHPSAFLQHAFAHFLSLGHHEPHARRVNQALQARMQAVGESLRRELPDFQFELPTGGASVWVRAPDWVDTAELALMAREQGVLIEAGEVFFMHPPYPCPYFRLRLSSIGLDQIGPGIRALALAVHALAQARGVPRVLARLH